MLSPSWSLIISDELFMPVLAVLRTKDSYSERYFNSQSIVLDLSAIKCNL